jgi:hypothetical protein
MPELAVFIDINAACILRGTEVFVVCHGRGFHFRSEKRAGAALID